MMERILMNIIQYKTIKIHNCYIIIIIIFIIIIVYIITFDIFLAVPGSRAAYDSFFG